MLDTVDYTKFLNFTYFFHVTLIISVFWLLLLHFFMTRMSLSTLTLLTSYSKSSLNVIVTFPEIAMLSEAIFLIPWPEAVVVNSVVCTEWSSQLSNDIIVNQVQQETILHGPWVSYCLWHKNKWCCVGQHYAKTYYIRIVLLLQRNENHCWVSSLITYPNSLWSTVRGNKHSGSWVFKRS